MDCMQPHDRGNVTNSLWFLSSVFKEMMFDVEMMKMVSNLKDFYMSICFFHLLTTYL